MSATVSLDIPIVIIPATEAKTTDTFKVTHIEENYGWDTDNETYRSRAPGRPNSVQAIVVLSEDPYVERRLTVWEGEEYLAVRGIWTDESMYERIKEILQAS